MIVGEFGVRTLPQGKIIHEVDTLQFAEGTGNEDGKLKMELMTSPGSRFSEHPDFE